MRLDHAFGQVSSIENLLAAWNEFAAGKRGKPDVAAFSAALMDNLLNLRRDLIARAYRHGGYRSFRISDPKPRHIHKAAVRDRLLHHAIYRVLYPYFDRKFIYDAYSCRRGKGTHRALNRFRRFAYRVSCNHTRTAWVLKCDIRKFFASVDQDILMGILAQHIADQDILWLIGEVVSSFYSTEPGKGLPLGNLTSQLLVNVYMNEFDQWVKHQLKARYYIRYADDFVILSLDRVQLKRWLPKIQAFLWQNLRLQLHNDKVFIKTFASGLDYLGWIHFPDHRVLRTVTKRRALRNVKRSGGKPEVVQSYLGLLGHGNAGKIERQIIHFSIQQAEGNLRDFECSYEKVSRMDRAQGTHTRGGASSALCFRRRYLVGELR